MKRYSPSGKFHPGSTLLWTVLGLAAGMIISLLYTAVANWNPYVYLNFIALIGITVVLTWISVSVVKRSKSRNRAVNLSVAFLIGLVSWWAGWVRLLAYQFEIDFWWWIAHPKEFFEILAFYARNSGMTLNGNEIPLGVRLACYGIEFLAFITPVYVIAREKLYFCEFCHRFLKPKDHFFPQVETVGENLESIQSGDLSFRDHTEASDTLSADVPEQYKLNLHTCPECGMRIFNFYHIKMKLKKGKYEPTKYKAVVQHTYMVRAE